MTSVTDEPVELSPADRHVVGSAVLVVGLGDDGVDSIAVWHVGPDGTPTGAWVKPQASVLDSPDEARRVLVLLERRAIVGSSSDVLNEWLERVSAAAGLSEQGTWWKEQLFSPVSAFGEIVERRQSYETTANAVRENNKTITELLWSHDLPDNTAVVDFATLRSVARIADPPGNPLVSEALTIVRVLTWLVQVWSETEAVKGRRTYVRTAHGVAEPLPPAWLGAARIASKTRLPL